MAKLGVSPRSMWLKSSALTTHFTASQCVCVSEGGVETGNDRIKCLRVNRKESVQNRETRIWLDSPHVRWWGQRRSEERWGLCPLPGAWFPGLWEPLERKPERNSRELAEASQCQSRWAAEVASFQGLCALGCLDFGWLCLCFPWFVSYFCLAAYATESIIWSTYPVLFPQPL